MKQKIDPTNLNNMPTELINHIGEEFNTKKVLFRVNKRFYNFFQPQIQLQLTIKLLEHVVKGEQDEAEVMIMTNPALLLLKGDVTDLSGRTFKNVSALQLALWALDVRYMAPMMLNCLSNYDKGEEIRLTLCAQFGEMDENGLVYELGGEPYCTPCYDFNLTTILENFYNQCNNNFNLLGCKSYWCDVVRKEQLLVPAHIAQHYCDPEQSFESGSSFQKEKFTRSLEFTEFPGKKQSWYSAPVIEGINGYAICRGNLPFALGCWLVHGELRACLLAFEDVNALVSLANQRFEDAKSFLEKLATPINCQTQALMAK